MDAVTDAQGQGPAPVPGLTGTGALAHHDLLPPTGQVAGREQKEQDPSGLGHAPLAPLGPLASGTEAPVEESRRLGSYHRMN